MLNNVSTQCLLNVRHVNLENDGAKGIAVVVIGTDEGDEEGSVTCGYVYQVSDFLDFVSVS